MGYHKVFRDGKVHVCAERCPTCIFRPGNLMHLNPGRVRSMVDECADIQGVIPCHKTIHGSDHPPAICRGFYDSRTGRDNQLLQIADRMGYIEFDSIEWRVE